MAWVGALKTPPDAPPSAGSVRENKRGLWRTPPEQFAELDTRARAEPIRLRVSAADLDRAKALAAKKGIGYQTLLKLAIHEGLDGEEGQRA